MRSKPRILILTHNYPENNFDRQNAGIFVHDFAKILKKYAEVIVICSGRQNPKSKIDGVPVYWFGWESNKKLGQLKIWNPFDLIQLILFFVNGIAYTNRVVSEKKPDFCLAMWAFPSGIFSFFIKRKYNTPFFIWALGSDIYVYAKLPIIGFFIKKVLQDAKKLLADGVDLSKRVEEISGSECLFLPSASSFGKQSKKILKGENSITLTFLGRMENVKGPDIFLNALLSLRDLKKFRINFIGDGSLLAELKEKCSSKELGKQIVFHGNINDQRKIASILSISDWLVIPSRSDSIPLVFSEAMKMGIPVITSSLFDLKYLVKKYKVGLYFSVGSIPELSRLIKNLPTMREQRNVYARNTQKAAEIFNIETSAKKLMNIYYG